MGSVAERPNGWELGIDFGTSYTAAAVHDGGHSDILEIDGRRRFSSAVLAASDGSLVFGEEAERQSRSAPDRMERAPKRYLEVGELGIPLGERLVPVEEVVSQIFRLVWDEALRQHAGVPPAETRLTHPASWGEDRRRLLESAALAAGLTNVVLLSEPEAAATHLAARHITGEPIGDGGSVAVLDLGGGTVDVAVLRRHDAGFDLLGQPGGNDRIGGDLFDARLYQWIGEHVLPADMWQELQESDERDWQHANYELRKGVTAAKEAVSKAAVSPLYIPSPVDRELQITREEFEELIREDVGATLAVLDDTLRSAGRTADELAALYLVGGSSRIPLVTGLVRERFGRADFKGDPKAAVALGAAQVDSKDRERDPGTSEPPLPPEATLPADADRRDQGEEPPRQPTDRGREPWDELLPSARKKAVLDLIEEVVADARRAVFRIVVLRDIALSSSAGIDTRAVLQHAVQHASDFTVLRAAGDSSSKQPDWTGLQHLVRAVEGRNPALDADLPWVKRHSSWGAVFRPISTAKAQRSVEQPIHAAQTIQRVLIDAAAERPLLCLLDNTPSLDEVSTETLKTLFQRLLPDPDDTDQPTAARMVFLVSGGREGDPFPRKPPGTSLSPYIQAKRRKRERASLLAQPVFVHQRYDAPTPAALARTYPDPPVSSNGLTVL